MLPWNSGINYTPILNADWLTASTHVIILQNGSEKEGGLDAIPVTDYQVEETTSEREHFEEMSRASQSNRHEIEDEDSLAVAISCTAVATVSSKKSALPRGPVINHQQQKESWTDGYRK